MAFYLKYRSQTISQLDIQQVRERLTGLLKNPDQELPHALLFTGPRGTGKTSSARIVAKAVNCQQRNQKSKSKDKKGPPPNPEPCNQCSACQSITSGRSLDVVEIDAASHRGIDDIRDLREKVKLSPSELTYKIYIIDEVHMLTTEAFNALLKTLEEPPNNVIFILCTTELHKIPQTIVSRCVQIPFPKATISDLTHSLNRVAKGEKLNIESSALAEIAQHADGSFRDAQKILEQITWQSKNLKDKISIKQVKKFIGLSESQVEKILDLINQQQVNPLLETVEALVSSGGNIKVIFQQVLQQLHQQLINHFRIGSQDDKQKPSPLTPAQISPLISKLDKAIYEMKTATIPQLPVELALIDWLNAANQTSLNQTPQTSNNKNLPRSTAPNPPAQPSSSSSLKSKPAAHSYNPASPSQTASTTRSSSGPSKSEAPQPTPSTVTSGAGDLDLTLEILKQKWEDLINIVKPENHSIHALLKAARPQQVNQDHIIIEVWYPFHFERLNSNKPKQIVEQAIYQIFNCSQIRLEYVLGKKQNPAKKSNGNMIPESEAVITSSPGGGQVRENSSRGYQPRGNQKFGNNRKPPANTQEDDELIKFAEEIFGG